MIDMPQERKRFDSALVEKRGPSIVIRDPPLWTFAPVSTVASYSKSDRCGQKGSAELI
jgi:hypothetical protein